MKTMRHLYFSLCRIIDRFAFYISGALLAVMTILVVAAVISRGALGSSLPWAPEVVGYLAIWATMLVTVSAAWRLEIISIDLLIDKLSRKIKILVLTIMYTLTICFLLSIVYYGWDFAVSGMKERSPAMRINMFWVYLSIPAGGLLILIQTLGVLMRIYTYGRRELV